MLDVKRLRVLREVARQGSFSSAADALYLSQSAVSQQVATLEREVGMRLLERGRTGPKPTAAGRVLVSHADAVICRLEEAERDLAAIAGLEGGELRVASFPTASATILVEAVSSFHDRYPNVKLSVTDAEPEESLPRLRAGELDLALTFDYPSVPKVSERDLDRELILTESMYVTLPADHPLADRPVVPLGELADMTWLCGSLPSTCGEVVLAACRTAGFDPQVGFESDDYHVMQGFISAGLGTTLLPDLAIPTLHDGLVVRPTDPPAPQRRVWAATRAEGARSPSTEAMLAVLREVGANLSARTAEHLKLVA